MTKNLATILVLCLCFCSGCTSISGLIYSNTTYPLTKNLRGTPVGVKFCEMDRKEIREPITGINFRAQWDSNAIGDICEKYGLKEVYYADLHVLSILLGLWKQETVRVAGN